MCQQICFAYIYLIHDGDINKLFTSNAFKNYKQLVCLNEMHLLDLVLRA